MAEAILKFPCNHGSKQHTFELDKGFKDAVGDYINRRWPKGAAKAACKAFRGLTYDQAKKAVSYDCSFTAFELICKRGGPAVALPILEEVMGVKVSRYLREMGLSHENHGERLAALVGGRGSMAADRRSDPPDGPDALADRPEPRRRRMG